MIKVWCGMAGIIFLNACTTFQTQMGRRATSFYTNHSLDTLDVAYRVYLAGSPGESSDSKAGEIQKNFMKRLQNDTGKSAVVFLGDNVGRASGFPEKGHPDRAVAETAIRNQSRLVSGYKGKSYSIPGESDWSTGIIGLHLQAAFLEETSKNKVQLMPQDACGIEAITLSESILLVSLNSPWFLADWDEYPEINMGCAVKSREMFLEELESLLTNHQDKIILIAAHHPLLSNGESGGQYSFRQHIFPLDSNVPLPLIGTGYNLFRKASGWYPGDLHNRVYREMTDELKSIVRKYKNAIVVSGHEANLQYIRHEGIQQIISGAGAFYTPAKALHPYDFSYGGYGYAIVEVYTNGASTVSFYTTVRQREVLLFKQKLREPQFDTKDHSYPVRENVNVKASVYSPYVTRKSDMYHLLWGKHYKELYQKPVHVPVAYLDTLRGGLKPVGTERLGMSQMLLLKDKKGKEYWLIPVGKNTSDFLQTVAFKNQTDQNQFPNKLTEDFLKDYFTTLHPYVPLVIPKLSEAAGILHIIPELYYIPRQTGLGRYNEKLGDELFYLAEKPVTAHKDLVHFGKGITIIDTDDMLNAVLSDKSHRVDKQAYIRARLFDMLIGDWDRQGQHWQWSVHRENNSTVYRPIPLQRDQAFAKYDGVLLFLLKGIPGMGQMHSYTYQLNGVKRFNETAYPLDLALLPDVSEADWMQEVQFLQSALTNEVINKAFLNLPSEIQGESTGKLKLHLRNRLKKLSQTAKNYHKLLQRKVLITGTHKNDSFTVTRMANGTTTVVVYQGGKVPQNIIYEKNFKRKQTKELWLYGLDGSDEFWVEGDRKNPIRIRVIGGQGRDIYKIESGEKVHVYDFERNNDIIESDSKAQIELSNDYETNTYNYKKPRYNVFALAPLFGFNPDDGFRLGIAVDFTENGFKGNPFSQHHHLEGHYYFATDGYEVQYKGVVKKMVRQWDGILEANATSSNFAMNFFGFGNQTINEEKDRGFDYNRVKISRYKIHPGLSWQSRQGSVVTIKAMFDAFKVDETPDRFITDTEIALRVFDVQSFGGLGVRYDYANFDNSFIPTLGMSFFGGMSLHTNLGDWNRRLPALESGLNLVYKLTPDAVWVFETTARGKALLSNTYEFYQAAVLGGDGDLRGFREQRFTGKQSFYHSSDIRYFIGQIRNPFAPVNYGLMLGFDYGRVWFPTEGSDQWHRSLGTGVWFNSSNVIATQVSYFRSSDGGRLAFGMRFNF